jgi:hypothetical protein
MKTLPALVVSLPFGVAAYALIVFGLDGRWISTSAAWGAFFYLLVLWGPVSVLIAGPLLTLVPRYLSGAPSMMASAAALSACAVLPVVILALWWSGGIVQAVRWVANPDGLVWLASSWAMALTFGAVFRHLGRSEGR